MTIRIASCKTSCKQPVVWFPCWTVFRESIITQDVALLPFAPVECRSNSPASYQKPQVCSGSMDNGHILLRFFWLIVSFGTPLVPGSVSTILLLPAGVTPLYIGRCVPQKLFPPPLRPISQHRRRSRLNGRLGEVDDVLIRSYFSSLLPPAFFWWLDWQATWHLNVIWRPMHKPGMTWRETTVGGIPAPWCLAQKISCVRLQPLLPTISHLWFFSL